MPDEQTSGDDVKSNDREELPALLQSGLAPQRIITFRAVFLGLCGVVLICGLTPYNDYALDNTFFVGNNLPLCVVLLLFLFALLVNGPLSRFKPNWALSGGEITIAFTMMLVSCTLPSSGLMRYFPPSLVSPWYHARTDVDFQQIADRLKLPRWLFPSFKGSKPTDWMNSPIVTGYVGRWTGEGPPPYLAWVKPALTWGLFIFALYGAMLCMVALVRKQWFENERLAFPLATIYLSLIEPPQRGRFFNSLLRRRAFWVAFFSVFLLRVWNGASEYFPRVPEIPLHYDFWTLFAAPPWRYLEYQAKVASIYFTAIGVTYFVPNSVAFSLWFFFIARNIYQMFLGTYAGDPTILGANDQHFGGVTAYALMIFWIGRKHWMLILRQALRGARSGEPRSRYLSYPFAFWGFIGCTAFMIGWLVFAGAGAGGAAAMVILLLVLFMVITRIIAETGLVHGQLQVGIYKPWDMLAAAAAHKPFYPVSIETYYLGSMLQSVHYDFREVLPVYASHAAKVADQTIFGGRDLIVSTRESEINRQMRERRTGRKIIALMLLALSVGYVVSFGSTLWTEYKYSTSKDVNPQTPINRWGAFENSRVMIVGATEQYAKGDYYEDHSQSGNWTFGFAMVSLLAFLRLRYTWWPLHPVGFLMIHTFPVAFLWFSIFLGWLCKVLVLKFGGPSLYERSKAFFIGLIVGESIAAAFWLITGIVLSAMNIPYRPIRIMPG